MKRSLVRLVIAIALIAPVCGSAKETDAKQTAISAGIDRAIEDIAASQRELARPTGLDEPCRVGQEKRSSDLCAQWKAADAAADSAWWAWVAGWTSIIGTVTVFIAIALTYQANAIARDTARRQLRAYVGVSGCSIDMIEDGSGFIMQVAIKNSGQTPAYDFGLFGEVFSEETALNGSRPIPQPMDGHRFPFNPGEITFGAYRLVTDHASELLQAVMDGEYAIYLQGGCEYRDAFGNLRTLSYKWMFGGRMAKTGGLVMHACLDGNTAS